MTIEQANQLLGLGPSPTPQQVKAAFRRLAGEAHPDHGGSLERFHQLKQASVVALREAERQHVCQVCQGLRCVPQVRGFHHVFVPCPACRGTGKAQEDSDEQRGG